MQRHDDGISRGAGGRNERKELRCRNCTHFSNFLSSSSFEQGKKGKTIPFLVRRGEAASGAPNGSPDTNRVPL
ncbi:MAG: hypothetical protein DME58_01590 [Verrucomicrobia bacterium]|nr:MAG: hypothetical protein DME58_01590 [Verrucomicrobiota bacterium]